MGTGYQGIIGRGNRWAGMKTWMGIGKDDSGNTQGTRLSGSGLGKNTSGAEWTEYIRPAR